MLQFTLKTFLIVCVVFAASFHGVAMGAEKQHQAESRYVKRTIIGVYDSKTDGSPRFSRVHSFLEMPLNFLGYRVEYQDIQAPLAPIKNDVVAVAVWLSPDSKITEGEKWLEWLNKAVDSKKKLLLLSNLGLDYKAYDNQQGKNEINRLLNKIGVQYNGRWLAMTFDAKIHKADPHLIEFERKYQDGFPAFESISRFGEESIPYLQVEAPQYENEISDLVIVHPNGGYVASGYGIYEHLNSMGEVAYHQWYINPFKFLALALDTQSIPKADVTTRNGRRVFYSHVDGDGWNNLAELEDYQQKRVTNAQVLLEKIVDKYKDLPFTVGVTVAELLPECYGLPNSIELAKKIFARNNVEPSSHTWSHPLYWGFFADGDTKKEEPYLKKYPQKPYQRFFLTEWLLGEKEEKRKKTDQKYVAVSQNPLRGITSPNLDTESLLKDYGTPRSFACKPFKLSDEVSGAIKFTQSLAGNKKVRLYQWSGDTRPFEAIIGETRLQGVYNLNGGGSRYDLEYPSYTLISAIGVPVGKERQIYSSNTNENDYTNLWTGRFFGFRYLKTTVRNTESPLRIHPFNIYFHSYSAQKQASLNALRGNFDYAKTQAIAPMFASDYAAMANDFYRVEFKQLSPNRWRIEKRGEVSTLRFDNATLQSVDFSQSRGILGQFYLHGSLYVSLDPAVKNPILSLKENKGFGRYPVEKVSYLTESNWKIKNLIFINNRLTFNAVGFGKPIIDWVVPQSGQYQVTAMRDKKAIYEGVVTVGSDNLLKLSLPESNSVLNVTVEYLSKESL
jgi:hypothetical protein